MFDHGIQIYNNDHRFSRQPAAWIVTLGLAREWRAILFNVVCVCVFSMDGASNMLDVRTIIAKSASNEVYRSVHLNWIEIAKANSKNTWQIVLHTQFDYSQIKGFHIWYLCFFYILEFDFVYDILTERCSELLSYENATIRLQLM